MVDLIVTSSSVPHLNGSQRSNDGQIEAHSVHHADSADDFDFDEILRLMEEDLDSPRHEFVRPCDLPIPRCGAATSKTKTPFNHRSPHHLQNESPDDSLLDPGKGFDGDDRESLRLEIQALIKTHNNSHPPLPTSSSAGPPRPIAAPDTFEAKSPWRINRFCDLWAFFGPWLTAILGIQLYASHKLSGVLAREDLFPDVLPPLLATLIMTGCASTASAGFLLQLRGRDFHDFTPRLLGTGALSALFAITFHVVVDVI